MGSVKAAYSQNSIYSSIKRIVNALFLPISQLNNSRSPSPATKPISHSHLKRKKKRKLQSLIFDQDIGPTFSIHVHLCIPPRVFISQEREAIIQKKKRINLSLSVSTNLYSIQKNRAFLFVPSTP